MLAIGEKGGLHLIETTRSLKINKIAKDLACKYFWYKSGLNYSQFYKLISDEIDLLQNNGYTQENCIIFELDLKMKIGFSYNKDNNFFWLNDYLNTISYLPELDYVNKLNDYLQDYFDAVVGSENEKLINAIHRFSTNPQLSLVELYPEKLDFLINKSINFKSYFNLNYMEKLEFILGCNFKLNNFTKIFIDVNNQLVNDFKIGTEY